MSCPVWLKPPPFQGGLLTKAAAGSFDAYDALGRAGGRQGFEGRHIRLA